MGTPEKRADGATPAKAGNGANADPLLGDVPPELRSLDGEELEESLPTLADVGKSLPIGYVDQTGFRNREFELVDWTYDLELELGELASSNQTMPLNVYISELIGRGLEKLGTIDVLKMKRSQRRLLVRSLYLSDVLCIYVWIRVGALGHELRLEPFPCSLCGREIRDYVGDLRTLEVKEFNSVPSRVVKLDNGVLYGDKRLRNITVGPVRWAFMENDDPTIFTNPAKFKLATIQEGVVSIEGAPEGPVHLTVEHLRTMTPREINRLVFEIDQCNGGLVMEIRDQCPRCKGTFQRAINWSYESFFAPSSQ